MSDTFNFDTDSAFLTDTAFVAAAANDPFGFFDCVPDASAANEFSLSNDMAEDVSDYFTEVTQQVPEPMHDVTGALFASNVAPPAVPPSHEVATPLLVTPPASQEAPPAAAKKTATTKKSPSASPKNKKRKRSTEASLSSSSDDDQSLSSSSQRTKRAKVDKPDLKDRERLAFLTSLPNLTEAQKVEKKKVYNRITARESRRRQKDLQKDSEKRISELERENKKLKQKLAQVEKELRKYKSKTPHSPELNSEGGHSDSEGEYAGMSLAALTVLLIAIAVLLIASATADVGSASISKGIVPAVPNTCASPSLTHHSYPLLPSATTYNGAGALTYASTKTLLPDASPQTVYIPHTSRSPLSGAGVNFDHATPESLEKAYFYTTHDEDGKPTLYFYCPAIVPLLTDSTLSQPDSAAQRIVFVYPKEVYQNENELGERIIELAQVEVEKVSNLEKDAYLILQNGAPMAAAGGVRGGVKIASPRHIIM